MLDLEWSTGFNELHAYWEKHGHASPSVRVLTKDGFPLGQWCQSVRIEMKSGCLSKNHQKKLEEVGFDFDSLASNWQHKLGEVLRHKNETGGFPCSTDPIPEGYSLELALWKWLVSQRKAYKKGLLSECRAAKLESAGFNLNPPPPADPWDKYFAALLVYKEKTGNVSPPVKYQTPDGLCLGSWCTVQRGNLTSRTDEVSKERKRRLDEVAFDFDPEATKWEAAFAALVAYKKETGSVSPPRNFKTQDGIGLGAWCENMRRCLEMKRYPDRFLKERIRRLEEIGFHVKECKLFDSVAKFQTALAIVNGIENKKTGELDAAGRKNGFQK